jgi:hypothetical protein
VRRTGRAESKDAQHARADDLDHAPRCRLAAHYHEFLRGLRLAQGIADRKSTMPMLANVLLRTPRAVAMYISRHHTKDSYPDLARAFGGKPHATVTCLVTAVPAGFSTIRDPERPEHRRNIAAVRNRNLAVRVNAG